MKSVTTVWAFRRSAFFSGTQNLSGTPFICLTLLAKQFGGGCSSGNLILFNYPVPCLVCTSVQTVWNILVDRWQQVLVTASEY
jgi:hypothetical protein